MKKPIPFIALALCGAMIFAAPKSKKEKIPITRIYDEVLEISDYVCEIYEFQNGAYIKEIPVETYAHITTQEALEGYKKIADQKNDLAAMVAYTIICEHAQREERFTEEAAKEDRLFYLEFAASKNFAPAIYSLAELSKDDKKISLYQKASNLGLTRATFSLATYLKKTGKISKQQAVSMLEKIDFSKHQDLQIQFAEFLLGNLDEEAETNETERAKAILERLAENGNDKAAFVLFHSYECDQKIDLSDDEYTKYFLQFKRCLAEEIKEQIKKCEQLLPYWEKQAANGDSFAMYKLAMFYENPFRSCYGAKPCGALSKKYLKAAVEAGNREAISFLEYQGLELDPEPRPVSKEKIAHRKFLLSKAQKDDGKAMFALGMSYEGEPQERKKLFEYLEKSAQSGYAPACTQLGIFYKYGWSENPEDYKKCVEYFRKGAALGDYNAMYELGYLYLNGVLLPFDAEAALTWFSLAYRIGRYEDAELALYKFGSAQKFLDASTEQYGETPDYDLPEEYIFSKDEQ